MQLRRGLRFSDGHPLDADDVLFSFQVYLDENVHAPQRDLLIVGGKPIALRKLDPYRIEFELAQPYAAAERLFDGFAILPRHLLEKAYKEGKLAQTWTLSTPPAEIAGPGSVSPEGVRSRPAARARAQSLLLEARRGREPAAVSRRVDVPVRAQLGCPSNPLRGG